MHNLNNQALIFKAYRKGKSAKVPANNTSYKYEEVKDLDNYGATCKDGIIDISVDDIEMFEHLLDLLEDLDIKTYVLYSPHGGHTYWRCKREKIDGADKLTAAGFVVDIHSKGTYIPLKCDGKLREEAYDYELTEIPEVPAFLLPVNSDAKLWQLKDGEGRNDALSKHIFAIHRSLHLQKEEIKEIIKITNKYVLADPVPMSELETIMRDETFTKLDEDCFFSDKGKFLHNVFGDYLIQKYNIVMIDNQLHMFNGEIYEHVDENDNIYNAMIDEISYIKDASRVETLKYIRIRCKKCEMADERYIAFKNGIYDILEEKLLPFTPDLYVTIQIPWNYNPNAYSKIVDDTLNNLAVHDHDVRLLLEECVGYTFYRRNELGSSFFLVGDKSNGKSTFLKMIKNMLGRKNYSPLDLSELADRFNTVMMYGKLANIGDDIDDEYMCGSKVAIFKKIVTGDTIKAEEKGQPVFMFDPFVKLFFAANEMPRIKDKTGAVLRRIIIVPFNAVFSKDDPNFKHNAIKDLITPEATEYLIKIAIEGLHRILDNQNFTQPDKVKQQLKEYEKQSDTVMQFVEDLDSIDEILNESCDDVFTRYQLYCAKNGYNHVGTKNTLSSSLKKKYNIVTKQSRLNGKRFRIYALEKNS